MARVRRREAPPQPELPLTAPLAPAKRLVPGPAQLAKVTVSRRWVPDSVKLRASLTIWLTKETAERLTERAIAEGKRLESLAEILEGAATGE